MKLLFTALFKLKYLCIDYDRIWFIITLILYAEKWIWKPSHVKRWKNTSRLRSVSRRWRQLKIVKIEKWIDIKTILHQLSWFYFIFLFWSFVHSWLSGHKNYEQCQLLVRTNISSVIVDMNESTWLYQVNSEWISGYQIKQ